MNREYIVEYYTCKPKIELKYEEVDEDGLKKLEKLEEEGLISIISIVHKIYGDVKS